MSRVGKNPVAVPSGTQCQIAEQDITVKGKRGQLQMALTPEVKVVQEGEAVIVTPIDDSMRATAMWGTTQKNIANMIKGVNDGFQKRLLITGVGYRAALQGNELVLQLGHSHEIRYPVPTGISITCEKPTSILIEGIDVQQVGQVAAEIRAYRPPEPYKGKGVRYENEFILRKEGKKK